MLFTQLRNVSPLLMDTYVHLWSIRFLSQCVLLIGEIQASAGLTNDSREKLTRSTESIRPQSSRRRTRNASWPEECGLPSLLYQFD
jgi:hypothetical protein